MTTDRPAPPRGGVGTVAESLGTLPEGSLYSGILARARKGTASPRKAIHAFCLECVGLVRKDITECTATHCPLHKYRPYQPGTDDD